MSAVFISNGIETLPSDVTLQLIVYVKDRKTALYIKITISLKLH